MEATADFDVVAHDDLGAHFEALLRAYRADLGGEEVGVPDTLRRVATPIGAEHACLQQQGPADTSAIASGDSDDEEVKPAGTAKPLPPRTHDSSAAVINTSDDFMSPLQLWNVALKKYEIIQQCLEIIAYRASK